MKLQLAGSALLAMLLLDGASADVYLHHPRGSNNRLNERNNNRNNNNRLFDSQNNNKGGYAWGVAPELYYNPDAGDDNPGLRVPEYGQTFYVGSKMTMEWTQQHTAGANGISDTQIVIQMGCEEIAPSLGGDAYPNEPGMLDNMREGTQTGCDSNNDPCPPLDTVARRTDPKYGQHEHPEYYDQCRYRDRQSGLFDADQNVRSNNGATATRQNPNGNRSGTECPEERDYYPYWHPTPWIDVAVLTSNTDRCPYYETNSQNRVNKGLCVMYQYNGDQTACEENGGVYNGVNGADTGKCMSRANNPLDCNTAAGMEWIEFGKFKVNVGSDGLVTSSKDPADIADSWEVPALECQQLEWTRDNHLGNTRTGYAQMYNVTIPNFPGAHCVLRMRYNMTSGDITLPETSQAFGVDSFWQLDDTANSIRFNEHGNGVDLPGRYEINSPIEQDPFRSLFMTEDEYYQRQIDRQYGVEEAQEVLQDEESILSMAVNTNQAGRTFQDRTYIFEVQQFPRYYEGTTREHPCNGKKIHVLGVRGKRGNIVQTYPAVEHDFVPQHMVVKEGECVDFNWCLTDNDPARGNNNGEGTENTGRANIVQLDVSAYTSPRKWDASDDTRMFDSYETAWMMAHQGAESMKKVTGCQTAELYENPAGFKNCQETAEAACLSAEYIRENGRSNSVEQNIRNCAKLNAQGPCFHETILMNRTGSFEYMSSRENNFSNRQNKGLLIVEESEEEDNTAVIVGATTAVVVGVGAAAGAVWYKRRNTSPTGESKSIFSMDRLPFHRVQGNTA
eukprot:Rmarinus@m.12134